MTNIAFIGLGNMGAGMCKNLAKSGLNVKAFDLNGNAVKNVCQVGAIAADTIANAVADAGIIVSMLPSGKHVLDVFFGAAGVVENATTGALFIDCSTISVEEAREASAKAKAAGYSMVDAPVSGGTAAANAGSLTFMVGGSVEAVARAKPILDVMGKNVFHAGAAGNGQAAKIANNMLLAISMVGTCEAFALAQKLGLDAQTFFDISSVSSGQNWSMTSYCPAPGPVPAAPSNNDYQPGFAVDMMLKDLKLAASASSGVNAATPLGAKALEMYQGLSDEGMGGKDFSTIMQKLER